MKDYEIKYRIQRANELSRELMLHDEHGALTKSDSELSADALASYSAAILASKAAQDLDDRNRRIVGYHADDQAHDFRTREIHGIGPTDCEFTSRALEWYARELATKLEAALVDA